MSLCLRFDLFFILVDECNEVTDYAIARKIVDLHTKVTVLTQPLQIFSGGCLYFSFHQKWSKFGF